MRRMRRGGLTVAVAGGVVAAVFGVTSGSVSAHVATQARFALRATHGYRADFSAKGPGSAIFYGHGKLARARAAARAAHGPGNGGIAVDIGKGNASAVYFSSAHFKPKHFSARIGGFGRVRVRFHARQRRHVSLPHCSGYMVRRRGVFTGRIRFRGERGYTRVRARRAHGTVEVARNLRCHFGGGGGHVVHETQLDARTPAGEQDFLASRQRGMGTNFFLADTFEELGRGQTVIDRLAWASAPKSAFTFAPDLSSAQVRPPGPFSGSADFSAPDGWSGSLAVSFPGAPDVPLTGPSFSASLRRR